MCDAILYFTAYFTLLNLTLLRGRKSSRRGSQCYACLSFIDKRIIIATFIYSHVHMFSKKVNIMYHQLPIGLVMEYTVWEHLEEVAELQFPY